MNNISSLVEAWVSTRQRHFYNSTRGIATPEQRLAWEAEAKQIIAQHDRELRDQIAADIRAEAKNFRRDTEDDFYAVDEFLDYAAQVVERTSQ